jgi:predicted O-methyltransferase YrrM
VHGTLAGGRIADLAARDPDTLATRELVKAIRESDDWVPALMPAGGGLLAAVRRG